MLESARGRVLNRKACSQSAMRIIWGKNRNKVFDWFERIVDALIDYLAFALSALYVISTNVRNLGILRCSVLDRRSNIAVRCN